MKMKNEKLAEFVVDTLSFSCYLLKTKKNRQHNFCRKLLKIWKTPISLSLALPMSILNIKNLYWIFVSTFLDFNAVWKYEKLSLQFNLDNIRLYQFWLLENKNAIKKSVYFNNKKNNIDF